MTNEQKAQQYGQLLNEHTRLGNKIASIKGESIELNTSQLNEIRNLESKQVQIMNSLQRMMSSL
jgi:hypothetical protein